MHKKVSIFVPQYKVSTDFMSGYAGKQETARYQASPACSFFLWSLGLLEMYASVLQSSKWQADDTQIIPVNNNIIYNSTYFYATLKKITFCLAQCKLIILKPIKQY